MQLWFQIQVQLWRGHFISFSPELAKRQVNRHWNHNHEYELHYLTRALTSEDFLKELELVGCTGFSELAPALAPYHRLVPLWDLCGFIWGSGRPRWQWTEATGRAMEGWSHNQLTPPSHVSEGGSGERLAAIRRWGQLQPPINDSSTGSQMKSLLVDVFDQMFPLHRLDSSWTKQWARSVEGKRWCAWFISQDKTRALDWLSMQNSLSRLHCVSNSWKPNL